jgi:hypothetical protein
MKKLTGRLPPILGVGRTERLEALAREARLYRNIWAARNELARLKPDFPSSQNYPLDESNSRARRWAIDALRQLRAKLDRLAQRGCTVLDLIYWTSVLESSEWDGRLRLATKPSNNSLVGMVGNGGAVAAQGPRAITLFGAAYTAKDIDEVRAYVARVFYSDLPVLVLA